MNPNLSYPVRPMTAVVQENLLQCGISSLFLGAFGVGGLLLTTLGIYGPISYSLSQRQGKIGVRIALGATAREIRGFVVGDGMRLTATGLGLGLAAALGLGQLASFIPAARASNTDPITVLRSE